MPLTELQRTILALLAQTRAPDSYLVGGAALHFTPNSVRYSNDLDFFHDSLQRVASAFSDDEALLEGARYGLDVEISQPGFIRAVVSRDDESTRIDWAHDSAWRFMPPIRDPLGGFVLHDVDLAVNKTLALAGRDEPRDFIDILFVHERVLPLSALTWAAVGKDPGFTPLSLVEFLRRRGRQRPEEVARLNLAVPFDPVQASTSVRRSVRSPVCQRSKPRGSPAPGQPRQETTSRTSARRSSYRPLAGSSSSKVARILSYSSAAPALSC